MPTAEVRSYHRGPMAADSVPLTTPDRLSPESVAGATFTTGFRMHNADLGELMEYSDEGLVPIDISNEAYKIMVNYLIYAMTH